MSHAPTVAALYIGGWLVYLRVRAPGPFELQVALALATSLAAGWAIGRWWAVLLPVAVVPIFASPLPYTPGAEPEYESACSSPPASLSHHGAAGGRSA